MHFICSSGDADVSIILYSCCCRDVDDTGYVFGRLFDVSLAVKSTRWRPHDDGRFVRFRYRTFSADVHQLSTSRNGGKCQPNDWNVSIHKCTSLFVRAHSSSALSQAFYNFICICYFPSCVLQTAQHLLTFHFFSVFFMRTRTQSKTCFRLLFYIVCVWEWLGIIFF